MTYIESKAAPRLPIVIVGHVDHGKSTLIGRLLHDSDSLPDGKVEAVREMCRRRSMPFEWAFLMDAFQAERDQGITIDTTQIQFRTAKRPYLIIDAPGHQEFLKNMITGAANAAAALLVIDAEEGVREQTRRHATLLGLLGVRQVAVVVNKLDRIAFDEVRFFSLAEEVRAYLAELGLAPNAVIPASARGGDNIGSASENTPWYDGPTVIQALDSFAASPRADEQPLRLPVQDVYKFDERRLIVGRIESGHLSVGDELVFAPDDKRARIASIETWNVAAPQVTAAAGQSVALTLDQQIFVERGAIAHAPEAAPLAARCLRARLFWLAREPLEEGRRLTLKIGTAQHAVIVKTIRSVLDFESLESRPSPRAARNEIAEVVLESDRPLPVDAHDDNAATGRGVLVSEYDVVGGCVILGEAEPAPELHAVAHQVEARARAESHGHSGGVIWLTGLSGAGKSTLAMDLEARLFGQGIRAFVLDGDNLRKRLSSDLGFAPEDRAENIRRVAEVARLFAEAGMVAVVALISPLRDDRDRARAIVGEGFHEVHVRAGLETCESRDPKGLYARARAGRIAGFTGIDAPYEPPEKPELVIDTEATSVAACQEALAAYVEAAVAL